MNFNDFLTWELLATFAGASAMTALLTQWLKDVFAKMPTQLLSYLIALAVLALATAFTKGYEDVGVVVLLLFNAVIVSLAANGGFALVKRVKVGR